MFLRKASGSIPSHRFSGAMAATFLAASHIALGRYCHYSHSPWSCRRIPQFGPANLCKIRGSPASSSWTVQMSAKIDVNSNNVAVRVL